MVKIEGKLCVLNIFSVLTQWTRRVCCNEDTGGVGEGFICVFAWQSFEQLDQYYKAKANDSEKCKVDLRRGGGSFATHVCKMSHRSKPVFKRRPKGFFGVQRQAMVTFCSSTADKASKAAHERPVPVETASSKKLAISSSMSGPSDQYTTALTTTGEPCESYDYVGKLKGNRIVDCEDVIQALDNIGLCNDCKSPLTLSEDLVTRRGLVSKLAICLHQYCMQQGGFDF